MSDSQSEWSLFWEFVRYRVKFPKKSIAFTLYFFTIIVLVGLTSSFITIFSTIDFKAKIDFDSISLTLIGYSLVLLCSSAIEFIFVGFKKDEEKYKKLKNSMTMVGISMIIIGIMLSIIAYFVNVTFLKGVISIFLLIIVWVMWWISNSRTLSVLNDENPPELDTTTGGNPNSSLPGSLPNGYTV